MTQIRLNYITEIVFHTWLLYTTCDKIMAEPVTWSYDFGLEKNPHNY